MYSQQNIPD